MRFINTATIVAAALGLSVSSMPVKLGSAKDILGAHFSADEHCDGRTSLDINAEPLFLKRNVIGREPTPDSEAEPEFLKRGAKGLSGNAEAEPEFLKRDGTDYFGKVAREPEFLKRTAD